MHLNPAIPLNALDVEVLTRLGIAAVLGLLLGLDRELHGNPAGLRTHGLVCFSAALMTVIMLGLYMQLGQGAESRMVPPQKLPEPAPGAAPDPIPGHPDAPE